MEKNEKAFESFLQVCTVVKDAKKAAETWEKVYGIGPWEIVHATEENCRGRKLAFQFQMMNRTTQLLR